MYLRDIPGVGHKSAEFIIVGVHPKSEWAPMKHLIINRTISVCENSIEPSSFMYKSVDKARIVDKDSTLPYNGMIASTGLMLHPIGKPLTLFRSLKYSLGIFLARMC